MLAKLRKHKLLFTLFVGFDLLAIIVITLIFGSYAAISPNETYILNKESSQVIQQKNIRIGMVLGAGITHEGKPFKELQARLDVGAEALQKGYVDKLLLSGDNRFDDYDEPSAMVNYLVKVKGIDPQKLQADFAGRSTYESCERASKVFQQKRLIIISAESHLPRAIYLCRHFGIESYGLASQLEANNSTRREALARVKAVLNIYIKGEPSVLGDHINL